MARVKAVLRRTAGRRRTRSRSARVGPVTLDPAGGECRADGVPVALTSTEFALLAHLMQRPGRVFTREELLGSVWGYAAHAGTRTVDVHVAQVRGKLGDAAAVIRTVRGRRVHRRCVRCHLSAARALRDVRGRRSISVLVTALVGAPLGDPARPTEPRGQGSRMRRSSTVELLRPRFNTAKSTDGRRSSSGCGPEGIEVYLIRAGQPDREGLPDGVVKTIAAGRQVQRAPGAGATSRSSCWLAGPIGNAGNGVVLAEAPPSGTLARCGGSCGSRLLAGLAAGLLAGLLLARRIARPIRTVAAAANAAQRRRPVGHASILGGPTEVADLAHAVNALTAALATSEGRERDFLLSVSHELRTPLTTIRGYAEALADGVVGPDGRAAGGADRARRGGAAGPADRRPARAGPAGGRRPAARGDRRRPDAAGGDDGRGVGRAVAAAGLLLRTELPPMPVPARTDPGRIRQIIDGLLENALRVVPPGAPVVLALVWQRSSASIEIRDGGPGFTDDDLAVAFERGALSRRYQGARKVGSGLGLALAARLVRRLGGGIEAGHAPEGGARFTVTIPL